MSGINCIALILALFIIYATTLHIGDRFPELSAPANLLNVTIPSECENIGICDNVPEYPHDYMQKLINELNSRNQYFNKDFIPPTMESRAEDLINELCPSQTRLFVPQYAKDHKGDWNAIINNKQEPVQTFRVEICEGEPSRPCSPIAQFQDMYTGSCKQKYVMRNMVALDNTYKVVEKSFAIPSCCSCIVYG